MFSETHFHPSFFLSHLSNSEYNQAIDQCSLETHCPNGISDCDFPQSCWHGLTECDVRDFTPFEEGGFLNRPTQQELVEGMGLTYPSDDVSVCSFFVVVKCIVVHKYTTNILN